MKPAAIENARMNGMDDCSSVLSLHSKRLHYSMAVSFSAHLAVAAYFLSGVAPHGTETTGALHAMEVTLVEFEAPVRASHPRLLSTIEKPAAKEARPIAPAPKPEPVKDATPEPAPSRPAASESRTLASVAPERRVKTIHRDRREATGATAASQKAIGRPGHDDIVYVTEAHYREPPMPPRYPKRARELNQEGEALLQVRLDYEGNAQEILISQSSGYVLLDNAALAAARRWQFEPERRNGRPVIAWVRIPVRFSLN